MLRFLKSQALILRFDGESEGEGEVESEVDNKKIFDQDQVNTFVAEERRKFQEKNKKLAGQLEQVQNTATLTGKEREALQSQIDNLKSQYMSSEEKSKIDAEKARKIHDTELANTQKERDSWRLEHSKLTIETAVTKAADEHGAITLEQIAAILTPKTKLVEKLDDEGKPTGQFEPRVKFDDVDDDNKPVVLNITIPEAVKRMRELKQHENLFTENKKSGMGGTGSHTSGKTPDLRQLAKDPKEYRRLRKEKPEIFT